MATDELKAKQDIDDFRNDFAGVTVFCDDIASCNPLSNSEMQTTTGCRHDRSAGAYVLLLSEESTV